MNREIKFRAWEKEMMRYGVQNDWSPHGNSFGHVLQDAETVAMQFTGLLDKNGNEIYEGDVVRDEECDHWLIRWKTETAQFIADLIGADGTNYQELALDDIGAIIIGNIYEHKDLLV